MVTGIDMIRPPARFEESFEWLHAAAKSQTDLSDFGDPEYQSGLRVLLSAMDRDSTFSVSGREMTLTHLIGVLKARLYTEEGWRTNPEYRSVDIRPLVITA